jgi:leader peptidase (prepilin peptidase)/N-methyltransferase
MNINGLLVTSGFLLTGAAVGHATRRLLARLRRGAVFRPPGCELFTAMASAIVGWRFAIGALPAWWCAVPLLLAWLAVPLAAVDLAVLRLPNVLTYAAYPVLGIALAFAAARGPDHALAIRAVVGTVMFGGAHALVRWRAPTTLGAGDVKLAGSLGAVLAALNWQALITATALAAAITLALALTDLTRPRPIPARRIPTPTGSAPRTPTQPTELSPVPPDLANRVGAPRASSSPMNSVESPRAAPSPAICTAPPSPTARITPSASPSSTARVALSVSAGPVARVALSVSPGSAIRAESQPARPSSAVSAKPPPVVPDRALSAEPPPVVPDRALCAKPPPVLPDRVVRAERPPAPLGSVVGTEPALGPPNGHPPSRSTQFPVRAIPANGPPSSSRPADDAPTEQPPARVPLLRRAVPHGPGLLAATWLLATFPGQALIGGVTS